MSRSGPVVRDTTSIALGLCQVRIGKASSYIATTTPALSASDSMGAMANTSYNGETEYWDLESGFPLGFDATFPLRETNTIECAFKEITPKNLAICRGIDPFGDLSATETFIDKSTSAGTTDAAKSIAVDDDAGPTTETWTVLFTSSSAYKVYGSSSGNVQDGGADGTVSSEFAPDNGANTYFSIPASFFTGTWAADETYTFATTAFQSGTTAYSNNHSGNVPLGTVAAPDLVRVESVYTFPDAVHTMTIIFPLANISSSLNIDMQAEDAAAVTMSVKSVGASSDNSTDGNAVWDNMPMGQILFQ